jgi:lysophospholipase L1-like esterase
MFSQILRAGLMALALTATAAAPVLAKPKQSWTAAWASSQMIPDEKNTLPAADLTDATLRQVIRITAPGNRIRIRLSNAFGTTPVRLGAVEVAKSAANDSARILPDTRRIVTFAGQTSVTLPAGADYVSDPIDLSVDGMTDLTVSTWQLEPPQRQTSHPGARAHSYVAKGNRVSETDLSDAQKITRWYYVAGVEVEGKTRGAIAILGDSITDGYGVQPNTNTRWPDTLIRRLNEAKIPLAVLNQGIGGNRLLLDGNGPNAMARLERDVLAQPGVKYLIVLEGVNDLGTLTREAPVAPEEHTALVNRLIASYRQIIDRAHAHGITVYGATILPYGGNGYYHPDTANEADRQAVNAWIRTPGHFDGVIDFDALTRDPANPSIMKAEFDSGDHLHPSMAGYKAMGEYIDLKLFRK